MRVLILISLSLCFWGCGKLNPIADEKSDESSAEEKDDDQEDDELGTDGGDADEDMVLPNPESCTPETTDAWVSITAEGAPKKISATGGVPEKPFAVWHSDRFHVLSGMRQTYEEFMQLYSFDPCANAWESKTSQVPEGFKNPSNYGWNGRKFFTWTTDYQAGGAQTTAGYYIDTKDGSWNSISDKLVVSLAGKAPNQKAFDPDADYLEPGLLAFQASANVDNAGDNPVRQGIVLTTRDQIFVWGGRTQIPLTQDPDKVVNVHNDGKIYSVADNTWKDMSTNGAPSPRSKASLTWTGKKLFVWGGFSKSQWGGSHLDEDQLGDGGLYDPATDSWTPVTSNGAPTQTANSSSALVFWTGKRFVVIISGGTKDTDPYPGAIYNPDDNTWSPLPSEESLINDQRHEFFVTAKGNLLAITFDLSKASVLKVDAGKWEHRDLGAPPLTGEEFNFFSVGSRAWTGKSLILWGTYMDTSPSGQCDNAPEGVGCDPIATGDYLSEGAVYTFSDF